MTDKRAAFEQEVSKREVQIEDAESELANLRTQAEKFPSELQQAVIQPEKVLSKKLQQQFNYEKALAAEKVSGEQKLKDQTILSLREKIKEQESLIKQLSEKTARDRKSVV